MKQYEITVKFKVAVLCNTNIESLSMEFPNDPIVAQNKYTGLPIEGSHVISHETIDICQVKKPNQPKRKKEKQLDTADIMKLPYLPDWMFGSETSQGK